jgi:predicted transcriptional regulator
MPRAYRNKTSETLVKASERASQALELRKAGATYRQIGEAMGFTEQRAHQIVTHELVRLNKDRAESAEGVRTLELDRLDAIFMGQYKQAKAGHQGAVNACLSIMARRAKILGLDAPMKMAQTDPTGTQPSEIIVRYTDGSNSNE